MGVGMLVSSVLLPYEITLFSNITVVRYSYQNGFTTL